jgi:threonine/homoserine/homoserine lactone efflux protein
MSSHLLSLGSLALISAATAAVPGPNNFLIMRLGMRRGRGPALAAGLGTVLACILWCALAALGLAAVLVAAPWLYKALRIGGGLYLLYFAVALWRSRPQPGAAEPPADGGRTALWQGFAICMTNPKSVLFFAAIFAAYVGPDKPLWVHAAAVAIVVVTCAIWQVSIALLFSTPRAAATYARARQPLDRGASALMAAFGVSLLWVFD